MLVYWRHGTTPCTTIDANVKRTARSIVSHHERSPTADPRADGLPRAEQRLKVPQTAAIVAELAPRPEDVVVTKHTTSPFHTPDLGVYLRRFGMTTLILTGYSTTSVVEEALRDARDQDYECVVVRDGCAAATAQEHDT